MSHGLLPLFVPSGSDPRPVRDACFSSKRERLTSGESGKMGMWLQARAETNS
jgi:hypothetical protein